MKKNLFLMALAAVAMLATSCQKDGGSDSDQVADTRLKVRIANVGVKSRAVGAPAIYDQIALSDGIIFILNAAGDVTYREAINPSDITGSGQVLAQQVKKDDRVYIVGNLTTEATTKLRSAANLTLAQINSELLPISSEVGQDYTKVTLANSNSQSKAITVDASAQTATVEVNIAPVYSRIELAAVEGSDNTGATTNVLTSYDVAGVYVTDYYLQYSIGGVFGGAMYEQKQNLDFGSVDATMKDEGTWSSSGSTPNIKVVPETGKSWVYNVPAGALPRLILKINKVVGTIDTTPVEDKDYFLSLTGYSQNSTPITKMERAKIYRLEKIAFNLDNISAKPNEDRVTLTVKVTVDDWTIEVVNGEL